MIDLMEGKEVYLAEFSRFEKELGDQAPSWPHALRARAMERFAELGFPGPRDEDWKFTSLTPLAEIPFRRASDPDWAAAAEVVHALAPDLGTALPVIFANGKLAPTRSFPAGLEVARLAGAPGAHRARLEPYLGQVARYESHPFVALNTAFLKDVALVYVPKNTVLAEPIHLVFVSDAPGEPTVSYPRTLVVAEPNSKATVIQSYLGAEGQTYFTDAVTEIVVGENAHVDHYKLQRESLKAFHLEVLCVRQERGGNFRSHAVTLGGGWVRNEVRALFAGAGGECTLNGLYLAGDSRHVDNRTVIDHAKPHCASHELYKGILDGKAHGVFNGKIFVRQDAQKTDAKQTNQTLLLSEDAVINTKPQLEIFADDVKCTHGATVGQLSTDALFYLRSRGLGLNEARSLLTYAFANDIIERIQVEPLRRRLEEHLLARQHLPPGTDGEEEP
jgi:Fe-S cluster assembly protein SufD